MRGTWDYDHAIRIRPHYFWAYGRRGQAWRRKGGHDKAPSSDELKAIFASLKKRAETVAKYGRPSTDTTGGTIGDSFQCATRAAAPLKVEIRISGKLFVRPYTVSVRKVHLANTPGIVEISPRTLAEAQKRVLIPHERRYEMLRDLNAPEVIVRNELRMMDQWKNAGQTPEEHAYYFVPDEAYSENGEPDKGLVLLASLTELEVLDSVQSDAD